MSILSNAIHDIVGGMSPVAVWNKYRPQVDAWEHAVVSAASPDTQAAIHEASSMVRQGLSDAIALGDTMAGPLLTGAADAINTAFASMASAYLGPFSGVVSKAEHDAVNKLRDGLKAQIDAMALQYMAVRAAVQPAAPANPTPEQH